MVITVLALLYSISIDILPINQYNGYRNTKEKSNKISLNQRKWIVVTSINEPTEQIKKLSKIKGFQLLVVGDKKSKSNWSLENVIFLDINKQQDLSYKTFLTTPFNSYTRKNIGYLFAIENGAEFIYDTDDDNAPLVDLNKYFNFNEYDYGLIFDASSINSYNKCSIIDKDLDKIENDLLNGLVLNPYAHFGQPTIWPRGYPLSQINKNHINKYICGKRKASLIQQGVVNGDPDVDAIFRLTKSASNNKQETKLININFDPSSPSVQYPLFLFSPYNSQNTLIHYDAFWSLYLPRTVPFRLTDIWRSYWSQRLLWLINGTVQFNGPNAFQLRNVHSYLKDFKEETDMYLKTEDLVKFLLFKWKCTKTTFYECLLDLSISMAQYGFWDHEEVDSIKNWIDDLKSVDYLEPQIVYFEIDTNETNRTICLNEISSTHFPVRYTPKFQKPIEMETYCCNGSSFDAYNNFESFNFLIEFCKSNNYTLGTTPTFSSSNSSKSSNITLLVTFNTQVRPFNIIALKHLHASYFNNIIFCGKDILKQLDAEIGAFKMFDSYTFIELDTVNGYFHYYCMTKAIEMGFVTDGILLMSDDVLLKSWHLHKFDKNKIWYPFSMKVYCQNEMFRGNPKLKAWNWWRTRMGVDAVLNLLDYFKKVQNGLIRVTKENLNLINNFLNQLDKVNANKSNFTRVCVHGSDFFYLNSKNFMAYHFISSLFRQFNVFLEIAVPTILAGLESENNIYLINGTYIWFRQISLNIYDSLGYFAHPVKISKYHNTPYGKIFCDKYIKEKLMNL
jgi:hypothetical protein